VKAGILGDSRVLGMNNGEIWMPLAETGKIRTGQGWERRREFVLG
jgi:hypothetical protein